MAEVLVIQVCEIGPDVVVGVFKPFLLLGLVAIHERDGWPLHGVCHRNKDKHGEARVAMIWPQRVVLLPIHLRWEHFNLGGWHVFNAALGGEGHVTCSCIVFFFDLLIRRISKLQFVSQFIELASLEVACVVWIGKCVPFCPGLVYEGRLFGNDGLIQCLVDEAQSFLCAHSNLILIEYNFNVFIII